jgi:hypothetical protein
MTKRVVYWPVLENNGFAILELEDRNQDCNPVIRNHGAF